MPSDITTSENFASPSSSADRAEEDRLRLFNLSLDLLCVAGLDGYFKHVNPSWTRVLGWSEQELLSRPVEDFMHPEDRERTLRARRGLAEDIPVRGLENRYLCKDGSYRWLSWHCTVEPGATTVFGVARDVTERRQSDYEHLVLSKLESTGMLAAGIAHDFNNLLTGIQLNLDMVRLTGPVSERQSRHLEQALSSIGAARALTGDLIAFAQGGSSSAREIVSLRDLLRQAFEMALRGTNIRGECRIAPDLWPGEVNAGEIVQVIRNLVRNAREAMPGGGALLLEAANVELVEGESLEHAPGDYVRISLTDDGPGIPGEVLPRVFDPYFSTKERGRQKGMGLGLTICHAVLQKHGGMIAIVPGPEGRGTIVRCYLPAASRVAAPVGEECRPAPATTGKILVMDDEPAVLEIMEQTLSQLGCEVALAGDADGALALHERAKAACAPFDLVLLDLTMKGGRGGVEVLEALRQTDPGVKAVLMTGYDTGKSGVDYTARGFVAVLSKPFSLEGLRGLLAGQLATGDEAV